MAVSRQVAHSRFAVLVRRALQDAHDRGLSDEDISDLTTIGSSTFHRWQKMKLGQTGPQAPKVRAFFEGLGESVDEAFAALDWSPEEKPSTSPDPAIPPVMRELLRALADPNVAKKDKAFILETLKSLAARSRPRPGSTGT